MKIIKFYILILIITLNIGKINAQEKEIIIDITAKILNSNNGKSIGFATIVNTKKRIAVLSDSAGYFHFTILKSDILKISAIGFQTSRISFNDSIYDKLKIYTIYLAEKTYSIQKVDIYEARWKDLEYEFANIDIKRNETQEKIQEWFQSIINTQDLALITSAAAIGIPINFKTKSERQKIKVAEFEKQDAEDRFIKSKFNTDIIKSVTGLQGKDAETFMRYCNFNRNFLLTANEYEITLQIKKRFKAYSKKSNVNFN